MTIDEMKILNGYDIDFSITKKAYQSLVISDDWLPKEKCIVGGVYLCKGRNMDLAVWNGGGFEYMRTKFGDTFPFKEYHWDDGPPYGTVKPFLLIKVRDVNQF